MYWEHISYLLIYEDQFLKFEVDNEKLDIGFYGVLSFTCEVIQNEITNKTFKQTTWFFTI